MRRRISILFLLACIMFGVYFAQTGMYEVQAVENSLTLTDKGDYSVAEFTEVNTVKEYINNKTYPTMEGYIFAGWFTSDACTVDTAIRTVTEVTTSCYAKFVDAEVLSVKCQISEGTTVGQDTNIRFVSSVDSLTYKNIGFKLKGDSWSSEKTNKSKTVFERIASATEGDEYKFSPKVVDTESEYFITATWKGVTDFDEGFYVRAYWITLDGTTVYGESRYVTVNDGLQNNIINIPVKSSDLPTGILSVNYEKNSASSVTTSTVAGDDYTHLRIDLGAGSRKELNSATIFEITDGTTTVEKTYRNLYKTFDGTEDTSWFNASDQEFVIATAGELYGLAKLVNDEQFGARTVYMVCDIKVNSGDSKNWTSTTTGLYPWIPIANGDSVSFYGIFDGQGHSISGIYLNATTKMTGLFGQQDQSSEIKNFVLKNSYFNSSAQYLGSIVGFAKGDITEVKSSALVNSSASECGGIVGRYGSTSVGNINNCWYDGTITSSGQYCGGIVGRVALGTKTISNCLNSGQVISNNGNTSSAVYAGGICGGVYPNPDNGTVTFELSNSLNTATITTYSSHASGSIAGRITKATGGTVSADITDVYTTDKCTYTDSGVTKPVATLSGYIGIGDYGAINPNGKPVLVTDTQITGFETFEQADNLGFFSNSETTATHNPNAYWVARANGTPILKSFATTDVIYTPDRVWETDETGAFVINSVEELYGLAMRSQGASTISGGSGFGNTTIKLGSDITVNNGVAKDWEKETPTYSWITIGNDVQGFYGNFEGQGHTISGIYLKTSRVKSGLFSNSYKTLSNFKLKNSYFESAAVNLGSIVGYSEGSLNTIYSDAIVKSSTNLCGGMVGQYAGTTTGSVNNCWFDGSVSGSGQNYGGFVGQITAGSKTISNCLNSGSVLNTYSSSWAGVGGFCGRGLEEATITISNCINTGDVRAKTTNAVNTFVGRLFGASNKVTTSYTTVASYYMDANETLVETASKANDVVGLGNYSTGISDAKLFEDAKITGFATFDNSDALGFFSNSESTTTHNEKGYWVARANGTPILKSFATTDVIYTPDREWETDETGAFMINTVEELYGLAMRTQGTSKVANSTGFNGSTFKLGTDIVINNGKAKNWANEAPMYSWITIGSDTQQFHGIFDGQGHTISGVYLNNATQKSGLFSNSYKTLSNFKLLNSYFESTANNLASIVGYSEGSLDNIYSDAIIKTTANLCGGFIGQYVGTSIASIKNCWFAGTIEGGGTSYNIGGIVGAVSAGQKQLEYCLNTGRIGSEKDSNACLGGLIGVVQNEGTGLIMRNSLSVAQITKATTVNVGSIVGGTKGSTTTTIDRVYTLDDSYSNWCSGAYGEAFGTVVSFADKNSIIGGAAHTNTDLDFVKHWVAKENDYPELQNFTSSADKIAYTTIKPYTGWYDKTQTTPQMLYTAADLYGLAQLVNGGNDLSSKHIMLANDIAVNTGDSSVWSTNAPTYTWTPIGSLTSGKGFNGIFDGDGYSISGLYFISEDKGIGLFGSTKANSEIKNLKLENTYFCATNTDAGSGEQIGTQFGAIVGRCFGNLTNIYVTDTVYLECYEKYCGGLAGYSKYGTNKTYSKCWFDGNIDLKTTGSYGGGIVGTIISNANGATLDNCLFSGTITASKNSATHIGGLVGYTEVDISVNNCLVTGSVSAPNNKYAYGALFGKFGKDGARKTLTLTNVYQDSDTCTRAIGEGADYADEDGEINTFVKSTMLGYDGYDKLGNVFDFTNTWIAVQGDVPCLKGWGHTALSLDVVEDNNEL